MNCTEEMKLNILIAGGSGYLGRHLANYLQSKNHNVSILTRKDNYLANTISYNWDPDSKVFDEKSLIGQDVIINLSGTGLADKLWTKKRKKEIIQSRTEPVEFLFQKIAENKYYPQLIISASATGYYGNRPGEKLAETSSQGKGFLAESCKKWENAALKFNNLNIPTYIHRIGVVISKNSPFVSGIHNSQKSGFNVIPGNGMQIFPWIALKDYLEGIEFIIRKRPDPGVYNFTNPEVINLKQIQNSIRDFYNKKLITIHFPAGILKFVTGDFAEIFLNDQKVLSEKLVSTGYRFKTNTITEALKQA